MHILGIDPGSRATGWGLVATSPALRCLAGGVIRPDADLPLPRRLALIHAAVADVIARHAPQAMVVESLFNARNARSSLTLGHARGVILLAGAQAGLEVAEYAPGEIKRALTGNGQASKEQVRFMVMRLLGLRDTPPLDQGDALAAAVAHASRLRAPAAARAVKGVS